MGFDLVRESLPFGTMHPRPSVPFDNIVAPMNKIRKWLILSHRYLGIILGLLFVVWFASGIGMIYARGMPSLTDELRLDRLDPLDLRSVTLTPSEAVRRTGLDESFPRVTLRTVMGRPAYRLDGDTPSTVFADTGELLEEIAPTDARQIGSRFAGVPPARIRYDGRLTAADQWTVTQRSLLPLHKLSVDDERGTELYISAESGEVTLLTTRASRGLAWVAAIPHWLYFTPLRVRDALWRQTILWTAGLGSVLAALGVALGFLQFRRSRPFRFSRIRSYIPYSGWMRWHYIAGSIFGIFALTWVFSGLLSMEPLGWASGGGLPSGALQQALDGGSLDVSSFPAVDAEAFEERFRDRSVKEIVYRRILGDPYFVVRSTSMGPVSGQLVSAESLEFRSESFAVESLMGRAREAFPATPILEARLLDEYDSYHYSRDLDAPLPILRLKFDDPDATWLYIDPSSAELTTAVHRLDRVERWIYNGFHSLDFGFWYGRPIWDIGVVLLSLGGLATSTIGLFVGMRRLLRAQRP